MSVFSSPHRYKDSGLPTRYVHAVLLCEIVFCRSLPSLIFYTSAALSAMARPCFHAQIFLSIGIQVRRGLVEIELILCTH